MERAVIVKVAVSAAPYAIDRPYDYLVPEPLLEAAVPGVRAAVPFGRGNRTCEALILARGEGEKLPGLKPLLDLLDEAPVLDRDGIALALWLRQRTFCTVYEAVKAILPAALLYRLRETWALTEAGAALSAETEISLFDEDAALPYETTPQIRTALSPADEPGEEPSPSPVVLPVGSETLEAQEASAAPEAREVPEVLRTPKTPKVQEVPEALLSLESPETPEIDILLSNPRARDLLAALRAHDGKADLETLRPVCAAPASLLRKLEQAGLVRREADTKRRLGKQQRRVAELAVPARDALASAKNSPARTEVVRFLASAGRAACAEICYYTGVEMDLLRRMEKKGLLSFHEEERPPLAIAEDGEPAPPAVLNEEQETAYREIAALMDRGTAQAVLLHGVTGSGKTQVYLRLVRKALDAGKTALALVPEIALTPQLLRSFASCFGSQVAMLHSSLRLTERYDQWRRVRRGEARVVLGTRSAVFAPLKNLGLVILDEEQEGAYQSEQSPRYHARDVAKYLCARHGAVLVLGSATPSIETAWAAEQGVYRRAFLRNRYNQKSLPNVLIADLREELRSGNGGTIGSLLRRELEENIRRGEQSILFLNRRGNSRMLVCGECGHVPECPRCSVPMTYHSANGRLMCHYCGHSQRLIDTCPRCGGRMKQVGAGTQKAEEELRALFPDTAILRMDADTAGGNHEAILSKFEKENVPILLGTQMVAKGLDFENVTLAGVLMADQSLYVDHYRAAERTFNLLTQVVGRAGRGEKRGRAIIQTYTPDNDVIRAAAAQDYAAFYDSEIRLRRLRRYPPFADLFTLTVSGIEEAAVLRAAARVRDTLRGLPLTGEPEVLGPAPAPVLKVNNRFRYRVTLAGRNDHATREALSWLLKEFARDRENRGLNLYADCNGMD